MTGFGLVMFAMGVVMGGVVYQWGSEKRAAMAEIQAGRVPATKVRVAGVSTRIIKETRSTGRSVSRQVKIVSFMTEDGRYFDKGWSRTIKHRSGDWYKGYIVGGRLYVPDLYDELESIYLGFPVVGVVFFLLFWAGGKFVCRRIDAGPSHHG